MMRTIKTFDKNEIAIKGGKLIYLVPPLFVCCILFAVFYFFNLYPFSDNTISWGDLSQQVLPLLLNFKEILLGEQNIFLNMSYAGGMNFWGVFLFFLSSPFSFLVLFFDNKDFSTLLNMLMMLKLALCSFTAFYYLKKSFKLSNTLLICLSVMYALGGFAMLFYQNMMWLDIMYLFPILLLGLKQLITDGKKTLYIICLAGVIVLNYYLSYMIVLFIVFSSGIIIFMIDDTNKRKQSIFDLFNATVISALLTMVVWLPSFYQYLFSGRKESIIDSLSSGYFITSFYTVLPVLFCSAALPIIFLIFTKSKLYKKDVIKPIIIIFIFLLIPIFIEPINKMWHTGSYQAFPVRYGYITVFIGIILLAHFFSHLQDNKPISKKNNKINVYSILAFSMVFLVISIGAYLLLNKLDIIRMYTKSLWGDKNSFFYLFSFFILTASVFIIITLLYKNGRIKKTFLISFCILIAFEGFFNSSIYIGSVSNSTEDFKNIMDLKDRIDDDNPYNVKTEFKYFDVNLLGALGYNNIAHYTSLQQEEYMFTQKKLGISSYWMEVGANGGTVFSDIFMVNNYEITNTPSFFKEDIYSNDYYTIEENNYKGSYANFVNEPIEDITDLTGDRIVATNDLFKKFYDTKENLFSKIDYQYSENVNISNDMIFLEDEEEYGVLEYYIDIGKKTNIYLDCFDQYTNNLSEPTYDSVAVYINDALKEFSYPSRNNNGILDLGAYEYTDVKITLEIKKSVKAKSFGIYGMDYNTLDKHYKNQKPLDIRFINNNIIASGINKTAETVVFSIPYKDGFDVTVNGKPAVAKKVFDNYIGIDVPKGENLIKLTYLPPFFTISLLFSFLGIILLICSIVLEKKEKTINKYCRIKNVLHTAFFLLFIGAFIIIYIFPIIVYLIF